MMQRSTMLRDKVYRRVGWTASHAGLSVRVRQIGYRAFNRSAASTLRIRARLSTMSIVAEYWHRSSELT